MSGRSFLPGVPRLRVLDITTPEPARVDLMANRQATSHLAKLGERWLERLSRTQQELAELAAEGKMLASDAEKATSARPLRSLQNSKPKLRGA